ncbi:hypothetical protein TNIN_162601 [Trichonephila inaurata madagascariensis]|uniref:Uncharacterized protein n=1 Tax=Trichonephila inaurata madagascariensis TaxID=2747483 RepID=A0A8X6Y741_9ARAC|nr:hypothetical protein TNIN_162601 [Trichonephila inaurata madagascariensis]
MKTYGSSINVGRQEWHSRRRLLDRRIEGNWHDSDVVHRKRYRNAHHTTPYFVPVIRQTIELVLGLHSGDLVPIERGQSAVDDDCRIECKALRRWTLPVPRQALELDFKKGNDISESILAV